MGAGQRLGAVALAAGLAACGGAPSVPCLVPTDALAAESVLQGSWALSEADGRVVGRVDVDGLRMAALSVDDETTFFGRYTFSATEGNAHRIAFVVDRADVAGQEHLYGEPTTIELLLVFGDANRLYSLQPDGVWVRWERLP